MDDRLQLHDELKRTFPGVKLFFNPTTKTILEYPCILYTQSRLKPSYANNETHTIGTVYTVTHMSKAPGLDTKPMLSIRGATHNATITKSDIVQNIFTINVNTV